MTTINPQHKAFIAHYLRTHNKREAYRQAYPQITTADSLRVASNRLFRQLKPQIDELESHATELAVQELLADAKERIKAEICTMQRRREALAEIILGHRKIKRHIRLRDSLVEVEDDFPATAVIRAIDLDSKLAANMYREVIKTESPKPMLQNTPAEQVTKPQPLSQRLKQYPFGDPYWKNTMVRPHSSEVAELGFDLLDNGVPYKDGEILPSYRQQLWQQEIDGFKKLYPSLPPDYLFTPVEHTQPQQEEQPANTSNTETKRNNPLPNPAPETDLWQQYLAADSNTRALHPQDRKQKETWFRAIPLKQQLKLIALYRHTG